MPVNSAQVVQGLGDFALGNKLFYDIAKNPFFTALIICTIVFIIAFFAVITGYPEIKHPWSLALRIGAYSLLFNTFFMFLHNKILMKEIKEGSDHMVAQNVITGSGMDSENDPNIVPIKIKPMAWQT